MSEASYQESETEESGSSKSARRSCMGCGCSTGCLTVLAVLSLLVGLLVVSAPAILRHYTMKGMTADEAKRLNTLLREPVDFPNEWQHVRPFSPELKASVERTSKEMSASTGAAYTRDHFTTVTEALKSLQDGDPIGQDEWTSIAEVLKDSAPLLDATSVTVRVPDYAVDVMVRSDFGGASATGIGAGHVYQVVRWWCLAAHQAAKAGDWTSAFAQVECTFRMAQTGAAPTDDAQRFQQFAIRSAAFCTGLLATSCTQVQPMKELLHTLQELRPRLIHTTRMDPLVLDSIGKLRQFARDGFPSKLEPGKTGVFYTLQAMEAEYFKYPRFMVESLPITDPRRAEFERHFGRDPTVIGFLRVSTLLRLATSFAPDVVLRFMLRMRPSGTVDIQRSQVYLDLAMLELAARISQLESQPAPTNVAQLSPKYIEVLPTDPFSGKAYLMDPGSGSFYSVGPDGRDEHLKSYSNRGNNSGDISLGDTEYDYYW